MKKILIISLLLSFLFSCGSLNQRYPKQTVLPRYKVDGKQLCNGVFFTPHDFRANQPNLHQVEIENYAAIEKKLLTVKEGKGIQLESILYKGNNILDQVWSINADGVPFVRYNNSFFPITQLGQLSSFFITDAGEKTTVEDKNLGPVKVKKRPEHQVGISSPHQTDVVDTNVAKKRTFKATIHYLIDMQTGTVIQMDCQELKAAISNDPELLNELEQRSNQEEVYYSYFLRYNQRHPLGISPGACD